MKSCGFLLRIFLAIFLGMCVFYCNCEAGSVCPPRTVRMSVAESVKCVCQNEFYGMKCQFRAENSLPINATWTGKNLARVKWQTEKQNEAYYLFARKVNYVAAKFPIYGKWTPSVRSHAFNEDSEEGMNEVAVFLRLNQSFSWEILLIFKNKNKSAAMFIDPPQFMAYVLQNNPTNNRSEVDRCPFYRCPEKAFGFITFFEDFNKPCFNKGMIIGVTTGVVATVIITAVIYSVIRLCSRFCCKKKRQFHQNSGSQDIASPKSSCVIIDIPDEDTRQKQLYIAKSQDATSVKSLFITLPEVTEIVPKSASMLW